MSDWIYTCIHINIETPDFCIPRCWFETLNDCFLSLSLIPLFRLWIIYEYLCFYSPSARFMLLKTFWSLKLLSLLFTLMELTTSNCHPNNSYQPDRWPANRSSIPCMGTWLTLHVLTYIAEVITILSKFYLEHLKSTYQPQTLRHDS